MEGERGGAMPLLVSGNFSGLGGVFYKCTDSVQYSTGGWYEGRCDAPLGQWQVTWKRPLNFFDKSAQALHKCCISMTAFWNTRKHWETMLKVGQMLKTNPTSLTSPKRTYMA